MDEYTQIKKYEVTEGSTLGGTSSVDVEIYCYDFDTADRLAAEIKEGMAEAGGYSELIISRDEYTPEYQVDFDRTKLAVNGLNSTSAASYLMAAMNGTVGSFFREDGDEYDIRVRYAPEFRTSIEDIENILVYAPMGNVIRIKDLGAVIETDVPTAIERKDRERVITVNGVVADGYSLSDVVEMTEQMIAAMDIPSGPPSR